MTLTPNATPLHEGYRTKPTIDIHTTHGIHQGISSLLSSQLVLNSSHIAIDCYPGVNIVALHHEIVLHWPHVTLVNAENYALPSHAYRELIAPWLGEDRVFGRMSPLTLDDIYSPAQRQQALQDIAAMQGPVIVIGVGASLLVPTAPIIYVDITRWEIQLRFRQGASNWLTTNPTEDILRKYKQGFFVEWRIADRHKENIVPKSTFYVDGTSPNWPWMFTSDYFIALAATAKRPFRLVPYFDPGVWGGQWMKKVCHLDPQKPNYAWSFDGVPEENSLLFSEAHHRIESPAMNLVLFASTALLGQRILNEFGKEFPIRFDFLDTMGGGNLSLQVHPLKSYIREQFGMKYTQDESYYILDATPDSVVYLGFKPGIDHQAFERDLAAAARGEMRFPDEHYINKIPVKKHDHIAIPAGTIHCSGSNTMVLEISATPYIFTFKLWDWGRLGLDGKPRPIHLQHGLRNIQYNRDEGWVHREILSLRHPITAQTEETGLHPSEFIKTWRHTLSTTPLRLSTQGSVNVLNLVEGTRARVESVNGSFAPYDVYYAETFIVPCAVGEYTVRSLDANEPCMVIQAFVKE